VYHVDETCRLKQKFVAEASIKKLLYYDDKNVLVTVTTSMMLTLHSVSDEADTLETMKVDAFRFITNMFILSTLSRQRTAYIKQMMNQYSGN